MSDDSNQNWRKNLEHYLSTTPHEERKAIAKEQASFAIDLILSRVEDNEISMGEAALETVVQCDFWGIDIPDWARTEIARCWYLYKNCRTRFEGPLPDNPSELPDRTKEPLPNPISLERAFDIKNETNRNRLARVKQKENIYKVYEILTAIHNKKHPIDEYAFDVAGKLLGISGGSANGYYREILKTGIDSVSTKKKSKNSTNRSCLAIPKENLGKIYTLIAPFYIESP